MEDIDTYYHDEWSKDELGMIAGGAHPDGMYAYAEIINYTWTGPEDAPMPDDAKEIRIRLVRQDLYDRIERENAKLREERDILMGQLKERCNRIVEVNEENYDLRQRIAKLEAVVECARNLSSAKHNVDLADEFDDLDLMLEELAAPDA